MPRRRFLEPRGPDEKRMKREPRTSILKRTPVPHLELRRSGKEKVGAKTRLLMIKWDIEIRKSVLAWKMKHARATLCPDLVVEV
mmetsp:Transcript_42533/g.133952  ORF Transcript_42533/g.133952 Transcript_42533/m.133952 type:complete len:84 (+) Transcript_42533:408-659(+)